ERVGLHVTDVKVLRLLEDAAMSPTEIAAQTGLTGAAITALVDRLLVAGCVTREHDEHDRRRVTIRIVPAKIHKIDRLYDEYSMEMAKLLSRYDAVEFMLIEGFLAKTAQLLAEQTAKLRQRAHKA